MTRVFLAATTILFALAAAVHAGYQAPPHIDGCQSADGRFVITTDLVATGKLGHGPNQWRVIWKDTRQGISREVKLEGLPQGQIFGQFFMAPDGETFALFNHITLYSQGQSNMHGPKGLAHREDSDAWRSDEAFSYRLVIYHKNGSLLKSLSVADFLRPEEWSAVGRRFNRIEWLVEYDDIEWKNAVRYPYAFCRVSPDYTVLELQLKPTKANLDRGPRVVRVSLTSGEILEPSQWPTDAAKVPVRPCRGLVAYPKPFVPEWRERFVPSLDPVRTAGTITLDDTTYAMDDPALPAALQAHAEAHRQAKEARRVKEAGKQKQGDKTSSVSNAVPPEEKGRSERTPSVNVTSPKARASKQTAPSVTLALIADGYKKADTPAWLPREQVLLFTDLELNQQYQLTGAKEITVVRESAVRGKVGPDDRFYGLFDGRLASWLPGETPKVILEKSSGGRDVSLNDVAVGNRGFLYFTTLKDPEKGRLSVVDIEGRSVAAVFDGEELSKLANPNGIALSPDGKHLYVGISNYKARKYSGVYRFPVREDGSVDVAAGKDKPWATVKAPDGIAVDALGNVFFTAGGTIHIYSPEGKAIGKFKIPKGSGTNLCFGGVDGDVLYVTTWNALHAGKVIRDAK